MNYRRVPIALSGFLTACASKAAVGPALVTVLPARCQAINDSLASISELAALPEGGFRDAGTYRSPRLPAGTRKGTQVLVRYVSGSDGVPEPGVVAITGTGDATFREQAAARIRGVRLLPGRVEGCAVRSRIDVYITKTY